jgi:hypothetical protein
VYSCWKESFAQRKGRGKKGGQNFPEWETRHHIGKALVRARGLNRLGAVLDYVIPAEATQGAPAVLHPQLAFACLFYAFPMKAAGAQNCTRPRKPAGCRSERLALRTFVTCWTMKNPRR